MEFKNIIKIMGKINKAIYGVNPYSPEEQDKLDLERRGDLEDLEKDNQLDR